MNGAKGKTYIIADIGVNFDGSAYKAIQLIEGAASAGVDAVKFQLWQENSFPNIEKYRLRWGDYVAFNLYAVNLGLDCFTTSFDVDSVKMLAKFGQTTWKIPSNPNPAQIHRPPK